MHKPLGREMRSLLHEKLNLKVCKHLMLEVIFHFLSILFFFYCFPEWIPQKPRGLCGGGGRKRKRKKKKPYHFPISVPDPDKPIRGGSKETRCGLQLPLLFPVEINTGKIESDLFEGSTVFPLSRVSRIFMETRSRERKGDIRLDSFGWAPWQGAQSLSCSNKLRKNLCSFYFWNQNVTWVSTSPLPIYPFLDLFCFPDFLSLCDYFREGKKNNTVVPMGGYVGARGGGNSNLVL